MSKSIKEIAAHIKRNKDDGGKTALLIGAGCSVRAGIPTASGFVDHIRENFEEIYESAEEKKYAPLMADIPPNDRYKLISKYIDKARINWAHIAIAQLIHGGFVDRVLTTNFDPLIMRACALFNEFPAVYDMTLIEKIDATRIREKAIFHLHGQRDGFFQLHTNDQLKNMPDRLRPLFNDTLGNRTMIVVGYSGECDPVAKLLQEYKEFGSSLYWIGYMKEPMPTDLKDFFGSQSRHAHWLGEQDWDADRFLYQLAAKVDCPPPIFLDKPFTHQRRALEEITDFPFADEMEVNKNVMQKAINQLDKAITCIEPFMPCKAVNGNPNEINAAYGSLDSDLPQEITRLAMAGQYEKITDYAELIIKLGDQESLKQLAWAYALHGNALMRHASKNKIKDDDMISDACNKYEKSLAIDPTCHETLTNFGNALLYRATLKNSEDSASIFLQACDKYKKAVSIKPSHLALNNWGNALVGLARQKNTDEASNILSEAIEKYKYSLNINNYYKTKFNLGAALVEFSKTKTGDSVDDILDEACKAYEEVVNATPKSHEAMACLGIALLQRATLNNGQKADELLELATEKLRTADSLVNGCACYNLACMAALNGNETDCQKWLKDSQAHGQLPSLQHIDEDKDFDSVRDKEWFKEFRASLS